MKRRPMHPLVRLRKIIREREDMIATVEWWNKNRTDAPPMDCEPERVMLKKARECRAAWGDRDKYARIAGEMAEYATRAMRDDR